MALSTPNYNFPLYADADKPNLRDQYNGAIGMIDTQLKLQEGVGDSNTQSIAAVQQSIAQINKDIDSANEKISANATAISQANAKIDSLDFISGIKSGGNMVCIGDSWLEGYSSIGNYTSWGTLLAGLLGMEGHNFYKGGTGFGNAVDGTSFITLLNNAATSYSDATLVVIAGGINDRYVDPATEVSSVTAVITNARSKFPNAVIWVFPMLLSNAHCSRNAMTIHQAIIEGIDKAQCKDVYYSATCPFWIYDHDDYCADDMHPNQVGQNAVAAKMQCCIGGGEPCEETVYISGQFTKAEGVDIMAWRSGSLITVCISSGGTFGDGSELFTVPGKYAPNQFFGYGVKNDGTFGVINTGAATGNSSRTAFRTAYGSFSGVYSQLTWPINAND